MNTQGRTYLIGSSGERISKPQIVNFHLDNWRLEGQMSYDHHAFVPAYGAVLEGPCEEVLFLNHFDEPISENVRINLPWTINLDNVFTEKVRYENRHGSRLY